MYPLDNDEQEQQSDQYAEKFEVQFMLRTACATALYPLEYAKTLIQIGYEPIAPRPGYTLFGQKRLMLPNIFQYASHIKSVDGFVGCFRGLSSRLVGNVLSAYYGELIADRLGVYDVPKRTKRQNISPAAYWDTPYDDLTAWEVQDDDKHLDADFVVKLKRNVVVHFAGVVISHPFHVISVRMMAQFVGKERYYNGLFASIKEIWNTEGFSGFFSGLIPRLVCDIGCLVISSTITYLASKAIVKGEGERGFFSAITSFTVSSTLYPYHVVSTCMIVNGSRLKAGNLPLMDNYVDWRDCYGKLRASHEHKRGSSLFFRTVPRVFNKSNNLYAPYPEMK
ncbi:mitochondrial carrier homolog 2 [Anopheles bellator]|uniref:mitochondrial carrier homolog 2 n=1 Tax=Anopheles bellator TaxID=139047 RepID=UPI00264824C3|nr:mitochondrial carrier homolog 2 [Anopheles bellator]